MESTPPDRPPQGTTPVAAVAPPEARPKLRRERTSRRRLIADRLARWAVTAGGLAIIASILAHPALHPGGGLAPDP